MTYNIINNIKTSRDAVVLFGASSVLTQLYEKIIALGIEVSHVCDNDKNKQGTEIFGFVVQAPENLFNQEKKFNVIITSSFFKEIEEQLKGYKNILSYLDYKQIYDLATTTTFVPKSSLLEKYDDVREDYNSFVRNLQVDKNSIVINRCKSSKPYLKGKGLEIGAFHLPTPVHEDVKVDYVDQISMSKIKQRFPEFVNTYCVYPSIIDNGEILSKVDDESYDFIIANHMIEHAENFFQTINNHLRVLKKGGTLFYAVPDKRFTFDINRELTTYEHLKSEFIEGAQKNRYAHFVDFFTNVSKLKEHEEIDAAAKKATQEGGDTHFHVWTSETFLEHIEAAIKDKIINVKVLEHTHEVSIESITILEKL